MRLTLALLVSAITSVAASAQGGTGSMVAEVRVDGPSKNYPMVTLRVRSYEAPGGDASTHFQDKPFYLRRIPVGLAEICVTAYGYHTIFDTVTIAKRSTPRRVYVLQPDVPLSEPYPDCNRSLPVIYVDAVDSAGRFIAYADAFPMWEAVLRHYRRAVRVSEGDFVRMTFKVTGSSADTVGPAAVVMSLHRDVAPVPELLEWFAALTERGLVEGTCQEIDVRNCPQEEVTTFLKLEHPKRLHADTVLVFVDELGVNPASCKSPKGGFMGFWTRNYIAVHQDGRWEVVGRSSEPSTSGSGFCRPETSAE
ncbi:MAG TPA: hypothetical protein P5319_04180 [Gemmatimonadales bacterium]|nr:hypothetical protein [Gemmatimonadales bacterium]